MRMMEGGGGMVRERGSRCRGMEERTLRDRVGRMREVGEHGGGREGGTE